MAPPAPFEISCSKMNWGTCVDLPHPVSPLRTTTDAPATARVTSSLELLAGRFDRCVIIENASPFLPVLNASMYAVSASDRRLFSDTLSAGDMDGRSRRVGLSLEGRWGALRSGADAAAGLAVVPRDAGIALV